MVIDTLKKILDFQNRKNLERRGGGEKKKKTKIQGEKAIKVAEKKTLQHSLPGHQISSHFPSSDLWDSGALFSWVPGDGSFSVQETPELDSGTPARLVILPFIICICRLSRSLRTEQGSQPPGQPTPPTIPGFQKIHDLRRVALPAVPIEKNP